MKLFLIIFSAILAAAATIGISTAIYNAHEQNEELRQAMVDVTARQEKYDAEHKREVEYQTTAESNDAPLSDEQKRQAAANQSNPFIQTAITNSTSPAPPPR